MKLKFLLLFMCVSFFGFSQEKAKNSVETMYLLDAKMIKKAVKFKKAKVHKVTSKTSLKEVYLFLKKTPNSIVAVTHEGTVKYGLSHTITIEEYKRLQRQCQNKCKDSIENCINPIAILSSTTRCYCGCLDLENTLDDIIDRENPF